MGKFILIDPSEIRPSQDFLKEDTLSFIFDCYRLNNLAGLPPPPIVRIEPSTRKYVAIDGHNILAVNDFLKRKTLVFVADSPEDKMTSYSGINFSAEAVIKRNFELKEEFNKCLLNLKGLEIKGINSFEQLRLHYKIFEDFKK